MAQPRASDNGPDDDLSVLAAHAQHVVAVFLAEVGDVRGMLHQSDCSHLTSNEPVRWTKDYIKFCSPDRAALEAWAAGTIRGGVVKHCRTCFS